MRDKDVAVMWVNVDSDFQWLRTLDVGLIPAMWPFQCQFERNVVAQYAAVARCSYVPYPLASEALARISREDKVCGRCD